MNDEAGIPPLWKQRWQQQQDLRLQRGLQRRRWVRQGGDARYITLAGQRLLHFSSNDYMGLATHPRLQRAFIRAAGDYGLGSSGSPLVSGYTRLHRHLEEALARFTGRERALVFSSGYQANLGLLSGLTRHGDRLYQDRLNHASLIDAARLSRARLRRYRHGDIEQLDAWLGEGGSQSVATVVSSDAVFSMDGDTAPLPELAALCRCHDALLMVDDAHGFGVRGEQGRGSLLAEGLDQQQVPLLMATFGKALGGAGAFIAGPDTLIEAVLQQARSYLYSTALAPGLAAAAVEALKVLQEEDWRHEHLQGLIARFRHGAQQLGLKLLPSVSPIQPLIIGTSSAATQVGRRLRDAGLFVVPIRPPTVAEGSARLRLSLNVLHRNEDIDRLLSCLETCL